ncbi:AAA family ATPase [Hyphomicrobium sp. ghe19]|uniref:bifunctional aminoglycoside phosphotransferase/ATP-binding protein n=1 Tax=Hyphomicrobium sp. ghe19 TaxID=2682968 RepID=UPI0030D5FEE4
MAERNELGPELLTKTALAIADFHRYAAIDHRRSGREIMTAVLNGNSESIRAAGIFSAEQAHVLEMNFKATLDRLGWLLDERERSGKVRRCHGDLHLRNVCLLDGNPTLFDCLEFDEDLATIDVLYDLAFLLMDLWGRGLRPEANWVFNRYFDTADEDDGVALLPFFMAVRASVRAHVSAVQVTDRNAAALKEARAYFDLAGDLLTVSPPQLVAVGGLSGSGKSSVAAAAAHRLGNPPGARVLSSDRIRKRLYGVPAETRLPPEAYQPSVSKRVYAEQARIAATYLKSGHAVIADAVFDRAADRQRIEAVVPQTIPFNGFWLDAPLELLIDRVSHRVGDPSDATPSVLRQQVNSATQTEWQSLSAGETVASTAAMLIQRVRAAPDMAER